MQQRKATKLVLLKQYAQHKDFALKVVVSVTGAEIAVVPNSDFHTKKLDDCNWSLTPKNAIKKRWGESAVYRVLFVSPACVLRWAGTIATVGRNKNNKTTKFQQELLLGRRI